SAMNSRRRIVLPPDRYCHGECYHTASPPCVNGITFGAAMARARFVASNVKPFTHADRRRVSIPEYRFQFTASGEAMLRREFISLLGGVAAAWPLAAHAQQPALPVIGFLHIASPGAYDHVVAGLRRGLAESDFVEGRNVAVEYRWGEGQLDRMPSLLADLLHHQVSVIVASLQGAQVAKSAGVTIPVLFSSSDDPVNQGFVESLNRPGGNMTGVYLFTA